ncbi:general odorant-binding protein 28a [Stomoxys calcitrans]|uniref:general odorant-binding protein 28a n=1 Tax=Stomoxys calcitrans TaxID=35570 RepID=UPI0027E299CF|nr:general odorant-binding protein 28a [Stomoxys calcitrans]
MAKCIITVSVLCVLAAVAVRGEVDKKAAMADFVAKSDSCKAEVGAKEADVAEMMAKKPASSTEGKCLRSCVMKMYEVMDSQGKFVSSVALQHAETYSDGAADQMKMAQEIIDACSGIAVPSDHCEAAEEYGKCFMEQAKAHGLSEFKM